MSPPGVAGPAVPGPEDRALLSLLASSYSDVHAARALGVSERTLRRRVRVLMLALGTRTRFELGAVAVQASLIDGARPAAERCGTQSPQ